MLDRRTLVCLVLATGLAAGAASPAAAVPISAPARAARPVVHVTSHVVTRLVGAHGHYERTVFSAISGIGTTAATRAVHSLNAATLLATTPPVDQSPSQLELDDNVTLARTDAAYLTFHQVDRTVPWAAAHGITTDDPLTFSRATGRLLRATAWIGKGDQTKFLAALSSYSRAWLKAHARIYSTDPSFYVDGTEPTLTNFSSYEVTPKGWVIHFSEYQVAPYSSGLIHVIVPWSKLAGLTALPLPTP